MPNWCRNRVDVYSENKTDLQKVLDIFRNKESVFGQIIPEPNWMEIPHNGELPKKREMKSPNGEVFTTVTEFADGSQDTRWYDWRLQNWDTKWDVNQSVQIEEETWKDELESFQANFNTAWSPPEEICSAIKEQFDVSVSWFFDEPGMEVAGYL